MAKRKTFYVTTDLFEADIPSKAKLVLTYLSRCANRQGTCFPSVGTIAKACGICKNTARKALYALDAAGIISITAQFEPCRNGNRRRKTNLYTLHCPTAKNAHTPVQQLYGGGAADGGEINNNSNMIMAVPSVGITGPDETELERILDRLDLHLYEDRDFGRAIEQAIRTMYYADSIKVNGNKIPQGAVRNVLEDLTIDHIDHVQRMLNEYGYDVTKGENYLISCIYNAPIDCTVQDYAVRHA